MNMLQNAGNGGDCLFYLAAFEGGVEHWLAGFCRHTGPVGDEQLFRHFRKAVAERVDDEFKTIRHFEL